MQTNDNCSYSRSIINYDKEWHTSYVILFLVIIMKYMKVVIFLIVSILLLGCIYLKDNVMTSESEYVGNINLDDIIGYITINDNTKMLLQGYDNTFYLNHNYYKVENSNGEIFLDYEGDLINDKHSVIYSNINNVDYDSINIGDIIEINYFKNKLCYEVISNKKDSNLVVKLFDNNLEINVLCKKIMC